MATTVPNINERLATVEAGQSAINQVLTNLADEVSSLGDRIDGMRAPNYLALGMLVTLLCACAGGVYTLSILPMHDAITLNALNVQRLVDKDREELLWQRDRLQNLLDQRTYGTPQLPPRVP